MKKNFLMVASLLIAAMLMVVSCTQEVAPKNDGLVEVTLNTSAARSVLKYDGLKIEDVNYMYKLAAQWTPAENQDAVVGNTTGKEEADNEGFVNFKDEDNNIGYVSQGLWSVEVRGYINDKLVLSGSTQVYFNNNNKTVTVYVQPIEDAEKASLDLNIKVNDHDATTTVPSAGNEGYWIYYTIENVSGTVVNNCNGIGLTRGDTLDNGYRTWSSTVSNLTPGYYRVTVTMKNGSNVVGGITKGVLLFAGDSASLSGSVNSMDFVEGTLDIVYPSISLVIESEGSATVGSEVTYTATPKTDSFTKLPTGYQVSDPTYTWYENGGEVSATTGENNVNTFKKTYITPGNKTVTCVVTYTLTIPNGNNVNEKEKVVITVQADAGKTVVINPAAK